MTRMVVGTVLALTIHMAGYAQNGLPSRDSAQQRVVLSYFHGVLDGRKIELLDQLFLPDCVIHRPEGTLTGMTGIRGVVERNIAAYSKFETQVHDIFESADRVVVRISHRAMGAGEFRSRIRRLRRKGQGCYVGCDSHFPHEEREDCRAMGQPRRAWNAAELWSAQTRQRRAIGRPTRGWAPSSLRPSSFVLRPSSLVLRPSSLVPSSCWSLAPTHFNRGPSGIAAPSWRGSDAPKCTPAPVLMTAWP